MKATHFVFPKMNIVIIFPLLFLFFFLADLEYDGLGFHSGPKKLGDQFSETFHGLGTAIYASDSVDSESTTTLIMTGSVVVG